MQIKKVTEKEFDYFLSKIDWKTSFLDAEALEIMNRLGTLFTEETCAGCTHFSYDDDDEMGHCSECVSDGTELSNYQVSSDDVVESDFGCVFWRKKEEDKK